MNPHLYIGLPKSIRKAFVANAVEPIAGIIADHYGMTMPQIKAPNRHAANVECRMFIAYFLRTKTSMTLKEIGRFLGGFHHASVIHMLDRCKDLLQFDKHAQKKHAELLKIINNSDN